MGLRSAYHTALGHEPDITSIQPDFRHTIDYVFASARGLNARCSGFRGAKAAVDAVAVRPPTLVRRLFVAAVLDLDLVPVCIE